MNKVSVEISANVNEYVQGMNQASESTQKYESDMRKISDYTTNFNKKLRESKKEVKDLAISYAMLDKETKNSDFGKRMKQQLEAAKKEAAELIDMNADIQAELKNLASDTRLLDTAAEGFGVMANMASTAAGAIALVTGNEKDAQNAVVAFTTAQSAWNTAISMANALQKESNTMLMVGNIQKKAAAAATRLQTSTTIGATAAQKAFNVVANANPYVLLATAIISVVTALTYFINKANAASKEAEELDKKIDESNERAKQSRSTFLGAADQYYSTASRISYLQDAYKNCNSEIEKTGILKEAQKEFKNLGIQCNSVSDAQKILVQNGNKVTEMLQIQGDVAGMTALRMEAYKKSLSMLIENGYDVEGARILAGNNALVREFDESISKQQGKLAKLQSELKVGTKTGKTGRGGGSNEIKAEKDSLAALNAEYSKYKELVEKGKIKTPKFGKTFYEDFLHYEKLIKDKKIKLGIEEVDPKDIPGTEAWYQDKKAKLEQAKAKLPIDAIIERDQIQEQIDAIDAVLTVDVKVEGKDLSKALSGNFAPTIKGYQEAIADLQDHLNETDWSKMGEDGSKTFEQYTALIARYKEELKQLQEIYNSAVITPSEQSQKALEKQKEKQDQMTEAVNAMGNAFSAAGQATHDSTMQVLGTVTGAIGQMIPQILKLIGAKEGEAMASAIADGTKVGWPASIGVIASMVGILLSTFASIDSQMSKAQSFAVGGVVQGNSYTGDRVMAFVNSGEMILNTSQQKNLFDLLNGRALPGTTGNTVQITGKIRGTDLLLVQKNTNKALSKAGSSISIG